MNEYTLSVASRYDTSIQKPNHRVVAILIILQNLDWDKILEMNLDDIETVFKNITGLCIDELSKSASNSNLAFSDLERIISIVDEAQDKHTVKDVKESLVKIEKVFESSIILKGLEK